MKRLTKFSLLTPVVLALVVGLGTITGAGKPSAAQAAGCQTDTQLYASTWGYINGFDQTTASLRATDYFCKGANPDTFVITITPKFGTTFRAIQVPAGVTCVTPAVGVSAPVTCTKVGMNNGYGVNIRVHWNRTALSNSTPSPEATVCVAAPSHNECMLAVRTPGSTR